MLKIYQGLFKYKWFIYSATKRDFIQRFAASKFGGFWSILNPLCQVLTYTLILSNILHAKLSIDINNKYAYAIYLMAGLLGWNLFNDLLQRCVLLFPEHRLLLQKVNFPRLSLLMIVTNSCLANNMIIFIIMAFMFMLLGLTFTINLLWLIPLTLTVILLATGIGLSLGIFNVFVRDLSQVAPIAMQAWFWFTPVVYPIDIIPAKYHPWLNINPMYGIVEAYHKVIMLGASPDINLIYYPLLLGVTMISFSIILFIRVNSELADAL